MSVLVKVVTIGVRNGDPSSNNSRVSPATAPLVPRGTTTSKPAASSTALMSGPAAALGAVIVGGVGEPPPSPPPIIWLEAVFAFPAASCATPATTSTVTIPSVGGVMVNV